MALNWVIWGRFAKKHMSGRTKKQLPIYWTRCQAPFKGLRLDHFLKIKAYLGIITRQNSKRFSDVHIPYILLSVNHTIFFLPNALHLLLCGSLVHVFFYNVSDDEKLWTGCWRMTYLLMVSPGWWWLQQPMMLLHTSSASHPDTATACSGDGRYVNDGGLVSEQFRWRSVLCKDRILCQALLVILQCIKYVWWCNCVLVYSSVWAA